jgi:acetyltransferase-like isoleucine patch superfamily enzyme
VPSPGRGLPAGDEVIETERGYETATLRGGLGHKMARYMHRVTGGHSWARYIWQGTVLTLLSGLPTLLASELRARAYRTVLGGIGQGCTIERDVRLMVPRRIFLGDGVVIGEGCLLDANTPQGRIELQDDVRLSQGAYIVVGRGEVVIGPRSHVGHRCLMYGTRGIQIGRDVALANDVQLICGNHTFARRDTPIRAQPVEGAPIVIEDEVRVGASAIVLGGTTLGKGSVIAPGSVVTRSLPPDSLARGIPARVVGIREESPP